MFTSTKELKKEIEDLKEQVMTGYKSDTKLGITDIEIGDWMFQNIAKLYGRRKETLVEKVERIDDTLTKLMNHLKLATEMTEEKKSERKIIKTK